MTITNFEQDHVHSVYDSIALDFSRTRHTCWPFIESFLNNLPKGSIVLDAGCGNGKYLPCSSILSNKSFNARVLDPAPSSTTIPKKEGMKSKKGKLREELESIPIERKILSIGLDMSLGLLGIASGNGFEVIRGDCFDMTCWRKGIFDHAISIAIIHHFATPERRLESVKQLIQSVLPLYPSEPIASTSTSSSKQSTILIVVWALEQDSNLSGLGSARRTKKGVLPISSHNTEEGKEEVKEGQGEGEGEGGEQDVFVKWELQPPPMKKVKPIQFKRKEYVPPTTLSSSSDTIESIPKQPVVEVPLVVEEPVVEVVVEEIPKPSFNRYYHLFKHFELSTLVELAAKSLGANFKSSCSDYVSTLLEEGEGLNGIDLNGNEKGGKEESGEGEGEGEGEGWKMEVELIEEVWERENWCAKIGVKWVKRV